MRVSAVACLALTLVSLPSFAYAHFFWVVATPGEHAEKVSVYFSEDASPDDPDLLERVLNAEAWGMGDGRGEPEALKLAKQGDALEAPLSEKYRSGPIVLRHKYDVVTRGGESFLLNYYAKTYPSTLPGTWRALLSTERLPLEVTPELKGSKLILAVTWQSKPLAGSEVVVAGPGIDEAMKLTTNEQGIVECPASKEGLFSIRAKHVQAESGEHNGKKYASIRHYSTLALRVSPAQVQSVSHQLPPLPKGITSFGGAIDGDWLYVYGGHYGQAHHYSQDGQSGDFLRLNLRTPGEWEQLPGGPKLTGLAMVSHKGRLYRVGGFTANNNDDEEEKLESQSSFARYNPVSGNWEELPPLPEGRSSHDAAIIGDRLFVAGGWSMQPGQQTRWLDTAWSVNLSSSDLSWERLPQPPVRRRALTLAAWQGKLCCIGGMQPQGGPTTAVAVYDPATEKWSEGPGLLGGAMDGFGASAFAAGNSLYASTMSGAVQRLSSADGNWEFVAQLEHPRFFHRLLPWTASELVIVGGAHMSAGKIQQLEVIRVPATERAGL